MFTNLRNLEKQSFNRLSLDDPYLMQQLSKHRKRPKIKQILKNCEKISNELLKRRKRNSSCKLGHLEALKVTAKKKGPKEAKVNRDCFLEKKECVVEHYKRNILGITSYNPNDLFQIQKPGLLKAISPNDGDFYDRDTICVHHDGFIFPVHTIMQSHELVPEANENLFMDPTGLQNFGVTCFMNSVLQCLFALPIFVNYLVTSFGSYCICHDDPFEPNSHCYLCDMRSLAVHKFHHNINMNPISLFKHLKNLSSAFIRNQQQDSSEFFGCLIERISQISVLNHIHSFGQHSFKSYLSDPISSIFDIHTERKRYCSKCKDVEISFPSQKYLMVTAEKNTSLQSAMDDLFSKVDTFKHYTCDKCKVRGSIRITSKIRHLPPVLVISINRNDMHKLGRKLTNRLRTPQVLNLRSYVSSACQSANNDEDCTYELRSFVSHVGVHTSMGHYYADVKSCYSKSPDKWFRCNDSQVYPNKIKDEQIDQASMLFYIKVTKSNSLNRPHHGASYYIPYTFEKDQ